MSDVSPTNNAVSNITLDQLPSHLDKVEKEIQDALQAGNYNLALQLAQENGLKDTANYIQAIIYVNQAMSIATQDPDEANSLLQLASSLAPNLNLTPYFGYIQVVKLLRQARDLASQGNFDQALNALNQALQVAQNSGLSQDTINQIQNYIQTVQATQTVNQYLNQANQYLNQGDFQDAYTYFQKAYDTLSQVGIQNQELSQIVTATSYLTQLPQPPQPPQDNKPESVLNFLEAYDSYLQSTLTTIQTFNSIED